MRVCVLFESNVILFFSPRMPAICHPPPLPALRSSNSSLAQSSPEPYIAMSRSLRLHTGINDEVKATLEVKKALSKPTLVPLVTRWALKDYLVGDRLTIADTALFPYIHVAEEGGCSLESYTAICRSIGYIEAVPWFVPRGQA